MSDVWLVWNKGFKSVYVKWICLLHSRLHLWPIANSTGQMGDGRSGRAVNESESGEMRVFQGLGWVMDMERDSMREASGGPVFMCVAQFTQACICMGRTCVWVCWGPVVWSLILALECSCSLCLSMTRSLSSFLAFSQRCRMTGSHNYAF